MFHSAGSLKWGGSIPKLLILPGALPAHPLLHWLLPCGAQPLREQTGAPIKVGGGQQLDTNHFPILAKAAEL